LGFGRVGEEVEEEGLGFQLIFELWLVAFESEGLPVFQLEDPGGTASFCDGAGLEGQGDLDGVVGNFGGHAYEVLDDLLILYGDGVPEVGVMEGFQIVVLEWLLGFHCLFDVVGLLANKVVVGIA
jgi:hypothetical protein